MAGNLFVLPKQVPIVGGIVVPGGKLVFTQTGTTTPQNTYEDLDLTTPHENPVEADAAGVFPPIYFDPSFGAYRVKLTEADDSLIYQVDGVPASQSGQNLELEDAAPYVQFRESDASSNNKVWRLYVNSEQFKLQLGNDDEDTFVDIVTIDRTANNGDLLALIIDAITNSGTLVNTGAATFGAGITSTGADNLGRGWSICKYKSAVREITSQTIPSNDADLVYAIPATGTYKIECFVSFWGTSTGTQGLNANINYSGTISNGSRLLKAGYINGSSVDFTSAAIASVTTAVSHSATDISTTAYADSMLWVGTLIAGSTGNIAFAAAQEASDANATNIAPGSYLKITKLS